MAVKYKHLCTRCKKAWVLCTWKSRYPVCYECEKTSLKGPIKDPKMKKMFAIPEKLYKQSAFLRDIKKNYLRWGNLTDKQIEAFKKAVESLKNPEL